jgi:retinol-binding protein 3
MKKGLLLTLFSAMIAIQMINAQNQPTPLTDTERTEVVDSISHLLNDNYVFPKVAKEMTTLISENLKAGNYKTLDDPMAFGDRLTEDLQSVSHDKHLRVRFAPEQIAEMKAHAENEDENDEIPEAWLRQMKSSNFGFKEVKILDGNIGYLDLRSFSNTEYAGETATAAMNFLSNSEALIIDLRNNGGGSPAMIQLITSYLFGSEPVHLNNFYYRPTDEHTQTWTLPFVPGLRRPDMDVYVLTSNRTFSAAEEFSYNLKNLERATLIGETTGGGAHPGGTQIATDRFTVWVPTGRAINPITNTNWEGTGVKPHIEVPAAEALTVAQTKALQKLIEKEKDEAMKMSLNWALQTLKAESNPVEVKTTTLKSYTGNYGARIITFENDKLYYQRKGNAKYEMKALAEDLFMFELIPYFRLKIMKENNEVVGLKGLYQNGHTDQSLKDKSSP